MEEIEINITNSDLNESEGLKKAFDIKLPPNKDLVEEIKKIFEDVESGKIRSCIFVCAYYNHNMGHSVVIDETSNAYALIGGLDMAKSEIIEIYKEKNY